MPVTIVATAGNASANSFVTLSEADTFMLSRLNASTWETDASTDDQNRALVEATRQISRLRFDGNRADTTQILSWPRQWVIDPDNPNHDYFSSSVVPQRIKDATMELAFQYIKAGTTDVAALDADHNVSSKQVDVLRTAFVEPWARAKGLSRYPSVLWHLRDLVRGYSASRPLVRG